MKTNTMEKEPFMKSSKHLTKLTPLQKQQYLKNPSRCPYCGSGDIIGGHIEVDSAEAWQTIECEDCLRSWNDIYTLTNIEMAG